MNSIFNYLKSVKSELAHVVWPTKKATLNHTILVILISVVVAIFLFELDNIFARILNIFIK
ncbi:MAG: SecE/Sec61-gamma subunit of protein translocation complex [Candidatus Parcubacteria bacterium]|jgi:preprotein translocase subunit SecE